MKSTLESHFGSSAVITGATGRRSSFEITVKIQSNGKSSKEVLAWSKLSKGKFPYTPALINSIQTFAQTGQMI